MVSIFREVRQALAERCQRRREQQLQVPPAALSAMMSFSCMSGVFKNRGTLLGSL